MAHPEHLAVLQQGISRWNAWRVEHPMVRPDLADLDADRDLRALYTSDDPFDLANAHLRGSVIRYCSLKSVSLEVADLTSTELTGTTLNGCRRAGELPDAGPRRGLSRGRRGSRVRRAHG